MAARPPKTAMLRRYWNLAHWTIGRAVLLLAIANIFIGMYLSHIAYSHQIAQAVVLGGLLIIYMLKNTIDYLLVRHTPAEEERLLAETQHKGKQRTCAPCLFLWWSDIFHVYTQYTYLHALQVTSSQMCTDTAQNHRCLHRDVKLHSSGIAH